MKSFLFAIVMMILPSAWASPESYTCTNRQEELTLQLNVSRTTDGDLEPWLEDDSFVLLDYTWIGRNRLDIEVKSPQGQVIGLYCEQ